MACSRLGHSRLALPPRRPTHAGRLRRPDLAQPAVLHPRLGARDYSRVLADPPRSQAGKASGAQHRLRRGSCTCPPPSFRTLAAEHNQTVDLLLPPSPDTLPNLNISSMVSRATSDKPSSHPPADRSSASDPPLLPLLWKVTSMKNALYPVSHRSLYEIARAT